MLKRVESKRTFTLQILAAKYAAHIIKTHCTIQEAADYFKVPRSTLWWRIDTKLEAHKRAKLRRIAVENKQNKGRATRRKKRRVVKHA